MRPAALLLAAALLASPGAAQELTFGDATAPATLIADTVRIDDEGRLIAEGNVEALQGDARMTASRIVYDAQEGALSVEGPITLTEGDGSVILASGAELSADLRDGLLRSARVVLDQRLQLGANQVDRVEGRYTQLSNVVASSCEVCAARPVPLWQIRADSVVHDTLERQLYFENARFEVYGVPLAFLPRLRLPDPTVERATGFLTPELIPTGTFGPGAKFPYFIALSPSRDLTLTPFIASDRTLTVEGRYRQAFQRGGLEIEGALSRDTTRDELRGYLFGRGGFTLPNEFRLAFDVEAASDADYLDDYDISGKDRLDSAISIQRGRRDQWFGAEAVYFATPGEDRDAETRPSLIGDAQWFRRFTPAGIGGVATLGLTAHGHQRPTGLDALGRDVGRLTAEAHWRVDGIGPGGIVMAAEAGALAQWTQFNDDARFPEPEARLVPAAAAELRWPLQRQGANAAHLIEPVAQLVWTPDDTANDWPVDESTQIELDEGNLFSLSRFAATDRVEAGLRANLGITYRRYDPSGWSMGATVGRIVRADDLGQFDGYAAFDGARSDWLVAVGFDFSDRLTFDSRALVDTDFEADRFETRFGWRGDRLRLAGTYAWLDASPVEDRPDPTNQWRIDGVLDLSERWRASADVAYDTRRERATETEFGLEYRTECVTVDVGLRQRFTSETQEDPSTTVSLAVALAGFGASDSPRPRRRACLR